MLHWIQRIRIQTPSPRQPNRVLGDIPPLQRIVVPVTVIIQPRLLIVLLPWQTVWLIQVIRVFLTNFCYQLIINNFLSIQELKTSKMTTQLTTHFVEALRTTTNNNKQKGNLLAVLLNRYHFSAIRYEAGG